MKRKIALSDLEVRSFTTSIQDETRGGVPTTIQSVEPEFCNWTYNNWCYSNGDTDCQFCTAPK